MGPKLTNCCRPEKMDTKEFGKMMKRIQILEEGGVPAKEAKNWRIEGEKKRMTRKAKQEAVKQFRNGRIDGAKRLVELGNRKNNERKK